MAKLKRLFLQLLLYAIFAQTLFYHSTRPEYVHHDPSKALIKVSFSHAGENKEECHRLSQEELNALAPNMRKPMSCDRERVALLLELRLNDELLFQDYLPPSGLARDGASTVYERFIVSPGEHRLQVNLRDTRRSEGFDYTKEEVVVLKPSQNFVVDFKEEVGGFVFL